MNLPLNSCFNIDSTEIWHYNTCECEEILKCAQGMISTHCTLRILTVSGKVSSTSHLYIVRKKVSISIYTHEKYVAFVHV